MKKIFKIARFEFVEKVRTKAFIVFMVFFPIIVVAVSIVPSLLSENNKEKIVYIGIVDKTNLYSEDFIETMSHYRLKSGLPNYIFKSFNEAGTTYKQIKQRADNSILKGKFDGYVLIENNNDNLKVSYRTSSFSNEIEINRIEKVFNSVYTKRKLLEKGYNHDILSTLANEIHVSAEQVTKPGVIGSYGFNTIFFPAIISLMLLFMLILFSGGQLIRSVLEEKSNRIMEVLLSSCSAKELLTGKILGLSMLGIFQIAVWISAALLLLGGNVISREIFENFELVIIYFLLGYLLYTSIFVGLGSVVNTEQEAQHVSNYISMIMILPLVLSLKVIESPDLFFVKVLSYFPLTTSPVMLLRLKVLTPPFWEVLLTISIMLVSIYFTINISSKIFKIGILSHGKRPGVKELLRWMKNKDS